MRRSPACCFTSILSFLFEGHHTCVDLCVQERRKKRRDKGLPERVWKLRHLNMDVDEAAPAAGSKGGKAAQERDAQERDRQRFLEVRSGVHARLCVSPRGIWCACGSWKFEQIAERRSRTGNAACK